MFSQLLPELVHFILVVCLLSRHGFWAELTKTLPTDFLARGRGCMILAAV